MRRLFLALLLLGACHDSSGSGGAPPGGSGSGFTTAEIWLGRGPVEGLSSFSATLTGLRLIHGVGPGGELLLSDARVELVGLGEERVALVRGTIQAGLVLGVELDLEPGSIRARGDDGAERALSVGDGTLRVSLDDVVSVPDDAFARFVVDLDLGDSLVPDGLGGLEFAPVGHASVDEGAGALAMTECTGVVQEADETAGTLVLEAFGGAGDGVALGLRTVAVPPDVVVLLGDDVLSGPGFLFPRLIPTHTRVRVRGAIRGPDDLTARVVEVEELVGVFDDELAVRGTVLETGLRELVLLVREVEHGPAVLDPLLEAVGPELALAYDALTPIFAGGERADPVRLVPGQELVVGLCAPPGGPPFGACRIEIAVEASAFEGELVEVAAPFASALVRCDADEAVLRGGLVASPLTDVVVPLERVRMDVPGRPALDPAKLVPGLRVRVVGRLTGPAFLPEVQEAELLVLPGRLRGATVQSVVGVTRLAVDGGEFLGPFGAGVAPGPLEVVIDPACVFSGLASTHEEFLDFVEGLGASLELDARAIASGPGELRAFALRLRLP